MAFEANSSKVKAADLMEQAFAETLNKNEEILDKAGGFNTALSKLVNNNDVLNVLSRLHPDQDNVELVSTKDKRWSLSVSTKEHKGRVMLREQAGSEPNEQFYQLASVSELGPMTDQMHRFGDLDTVGQTNGKNSPEVFARMDAAGEKVNIVEDTMPQTLEEVVMSNPTLLEEFTLEAVAVGYRAAFLTSPTSVSKSSAEIGVGQGSRFLAFGGE